MFLCVHIVYIVWSTVQPDSTKGKEKLCRNKDTGKFLFKENGVKLKIHFNIMFNRCGRMFEKEKL